MKTTLTFIPEGKHFRVKELGLLCSLPKIGKVITLENYSAGTGHSAHPNIDKSGSVAGMIKKGFWHKTDITVQQGGFIYNTSVASCSGPLDKLCLALEDGNRELECLNNGTRIYHF